MISAELFRSLTDTHTHTYTQSDQVEWSYRDSGK